MRLEWSALDDAAAMAAATVKQEKRDKDQDLIRETLASLRRIIDRRRGQLDESTEVEWEPEGRLESLPVGRVPVALVGAEY